MISPAGGDARGRRKFMLLVLIAVFAAPFAASWFLFHYTQVGRTGDDHSHGQLVIPPRPLAQAPLHDPAGRIEDAVLRHRWTLLYLVAGPCERGCRDALYRMHQLRLALGRHAHRVQRVLVVYGKFPPDLPPGVLQNYPGQLVMPGSAVDGDEPGRSFRLSATDDPVAAGRLYVVDPMGNLMLAYPEGTDPAGIIQDLERLLRYSGAG